MTLPALFADRRVSLSYIFTRELEAVVAVMPLYGDFECNR